MIRQPIVTVAGHVDHGKTTILDSIRGSSVAAGEAGGITQKISFTLFPAENIKKGCYLIDKHDIALTIPGFLFIDTPGHAAFTNLRKRGGSLADLAILVVDINEGIMPQTAEVLQILKMNKVPFIIALNKIDAISGWRKQSDDLKKSIESQAMIAKQDFDEKFFTLMGSLQSHGFDSDLFYNITDFTKKITLVPCSAKTGEGIPDLLMMLCGLSQKFLTKQLSLSQEAKGVILEIKNEKGMSYSEAILHDGILNEGDSIAIANFGKPVIAKVRAIEEILPVSNKFKRVNKSIAASGLRLQLISKSEILPGMPFVVFKDNEAEIEKMFKKEVEGTVKTDSNGIVIKADSLGSLEALIALLKQSNIKIVKAGIGRINKNDVIAAEANLEIDKTLAIVLGFNVETDDDVKTLVKHVKILTNEVVYRLIEDLQKWQDEKKKEIARERLLGLTSVCKLEVLNQYVFRNSKPAIFGVKVLGGKLRPNAYVLTETNENLDKVKAIQADNKTVQEAAKNMEVAISLPNTTFDRQLKDTRFLYSNITESQFKDFKKNKDLLTSDELSVLQEIAQIKRREKLTWGV